MLSIVIVPVLVTCALPAFTAPATQSAADVVQEQRTGADRHRAEIGDGVVGIEGAAFAFPGSSRFSVPVEMMARRTIA